MRNWLHKNKWPLSLIAVFLLSRMLFSLLVVRFDSDMLLGGWQFLDIEILKNDLGSNILYLHSQPPLYNIFCSIVLKTAGVHSNSVFHAIFIGIGLSAMLLLWDTMRQLSINKWIALFITSVYIFHPALIMYEKWIFYSYFEPFFILLMLWAATSYLRKKEATPYAWILFGAMACLCLTRSMFHLVFFVAITSFLILVSHNKKKTFLASLLPFSLVLAWYIKNAVLFGTFSASSWFGINLAKLSTDVDTPLGKLDVWRDPEVYDSLFHFKEAPIQVPALTEMRKQNGAVNFNYFGYIEVSEQFKKESFALIRKNPSIYIRNVQKAIGIFFQPCDHIIFYDKDDLIREKISLLPLVYNFDYINTEKPYKSRTVWLNGLLYAFICIASFMASVYYRKEWYSKIIWLSLFIGVYIFLVGNLFELYENNRFRLATIPILLLFTAYLAQLAYRNFNNRNTKSA